MKTIGIIGFGNMGEALVKGLSKLPHPPSILVSEPNQDRLKFALEGYQAQDCGDNYERLFKGSDLVVLAIKPQDLESFGSRVKGKTGNTGLVSLLAGKSISSIQEATGVKELVRFMPNLAASLGKAVTGLSYSPNCAPSFRKNALVVAEALGSVQEIPEQLMSAIVGLSGSGIAFAFQYLHGMALAGTKAGIPYQKALEIAKRVMEGAIALQDAGGEHPASTISRICSPAGTTIEGITALEDMGFNSALIAAVEAAARRDKELED